MSASGLSENCSDQWEVLLLLISSEEKKIDRTNDNEVEVMQYFWNNEGIRKILSEWLQQMNLTYGTSVQEHDSPIKCDSLSLYWRQKGNEKFRFGLVKESYKLYTKSVLLANVNNVVYPLALANRSAALLRLKKYQACLLDIELAIKYNYPNDQFHKLYLRQADCYIELRILSKAKESLNKAKAHAARVHRPSTLAGDFDRQLNALVMKLEQLGNREDQKPEPEEPTQLEQENEHYVNASAAVELRCVTCTRSIYCSESCRDAAWSTFHMFECKGTQVRLFTTIGIAHLALRVLLVSADKMFPEIKKWGPKSTLTAAQVFEAYSDCDNVAIYHRDTHPFYRMFNLVTNFDKMNNCEYIHYALTATMLTLYLEGFTTFFFYISSRLPFEMSNEELRIFTSALILRSLGQLVCNGHATLSLTADDDGDSRTQTEHEVRQATAIYPSAAMMNHSCEPNIISAFYRHRLVIRSGNELPPNSEVWNCYGPHFSRETCEDRRAKLRAQYHFTCMCVACSDPQRKDSCLMFRAYLCPSCKGPVIRVGTAMQCQQCPGTDFKIDKAMEFVRQSVRLEIQAQKCTKLEEKCEKLQNAFRMKQQAWHRHNELLRITADKLARLLAELGDYSHSVELVKQNIQSLEYQYGSFSVEVGHELRKLSNVLLARINAISPQHPDYRDWCAEAQKILKKAYQLMELNYGKTDPVIKLLKQQESMMTAFVVQHKEKADAAAELACSLQYNLKM